MPMVSRTKKPIILFFMVIIMIIFGFFFVWHPAEKLKFNCGSDWLCIKTVVDDCKPAKLLIEMKKDGRKFTGEIDIIGNYSNEKLHGCKIYYNTSRSVVNENYSLKGYVIISENSTFGGVDDFAEEVENQIIESGQTIQLPQHYPLLLEEKDIGNNFILIEERELRDYDVDSALLELGWQSGYVASFYNGSIKIGHLVSNFPQENISKVLIGLEQIENSTELENPSIGQDSKAFRGISEGDIVYYIEFIKSDIFEIVIASGRNTAYDDFEFIKLLAAKAENKI